MSLEAKRRALQDLAAAHVAFKEAALHIPEEKASTPILGEWSVKDLVAHISAWHEVTALDIRRIARGHVPTIAAFREADVDDWNASLMRGRRLFPPAQAYYELECCYEMLAEALEAVPEEKFESGVVPNILTIAIHHYGEHGGQIREWRQKEGI